MTDLSVYASALAISGALTLVAGAVLFLAGTSSPAMTEASRQRTAGMGWLICLLGLAVWLGTAVFCVIKLF